MNRGALFASQSRYDDTLAVWEQAARISEKLGDQRGLAMTAMNRGSVFGLLSRYEDALTAYKHALDGRTNRA